MTDWSSLGHAYGSAEDIPEKLERLRAAPTSALWTDLWSALCHQGTVYSASYAALDWLTDTARSSDPEQAKSALALAGAILGSDDRPDGIEQIRARYAPQIGVMSDITRRHLSTETAYLEFVNLLETMLELEGAEGWPSRLLWGIRSEEYEIDCTSCDECLHIILGAKGYTYSTERDGPDGEPRQRPLYPASPADLTGTRRRIHELAVSHGQPKLAEMLTYAFGEAECADCGTRIAIADELGVE
ncbi:hypothetical protein LX16_4909 [Stackebrandtia albiflava]|uniref:Uncharacterized protein n=1 Tax=Stackebrandtia albiflava TaxID=406432 RepID=A0A562UQ71_9ACTN|nr:hypothetical protein [Stackebrandtia albiflava]TWJ07747.1 hypothetical protein LX16_4909 [Stackebrandtia albiflava]